MHSHHNGLKTAVLFAGIWAVLLGLGWAAAAYFRSSALILVFALLGLVTTFWSYWNSDKLAIRAMQAYPVTEAEAPAMHRIVRELSQRANQPMPRLYVSPTAAPNAFATGRNPRNAAVCCTEGILSILDERELRGVLGHELMHVYNRDILTGSVAAAIAGIISSVGQMLMFTSMFSGGRDDDRPNPLVGLVMALLAPLVAAVIQMAGDPLALASALRKLEAGVARAPLAPTPRLQNASHMMIANPFRPQDVSALMSTHPPMAERIARLEGMATGMMPR